MLYQLYFQFHKLPDHPDLKTLKTNNQNHSAELEVCLSMLIELQDDVEATKVANALSHVLKADTYSFENMNSLEKGISKS